jgi:hypothetical protein
LPLLFPLSDVCYKCGVRFCCARSRHARRLLPLPFAMFMPLY